jgi:hypothetical protein
MGTHRKARLRSSARMTLPVRLRKAGSSPIFGTMIDLASVSTCPVMPSPGK